MDHSEKTIKPVGVGGIAGGDKYIVQNILFKFAVDSKGLYGSDQLAMKVAGHDVNINFNSPHFVICSTIYFNYS